MRVMFVSYAEKIKRKQKDASNVQCFYLPLSGPQQSIKVHVREIASE